jgi:hypothetical protein
MYTSAYVIQMGTKKLVEIKSACLIEEEEIELKM